MMYFNEVTVYDEEPDLSHVSFWCTDCGFSGGDVLELDKFNDIVDGHYVVLKEGVKLRCDKCGKVYEDRKILYKKKTSRSNSEQYPPLSDLWLRPVTENQNLI